MDFGHSSRSPRPAEVFTKARRVGDDVISLLHAQSLNASDIYLGTFGFLI